MFDRNISALTCSQVGDEFLTPKAASWFFDPLPVDSYDLVVIDPPWPFKTWRPGGAGQVAIEASACRHHGVAGPGSAEE